MTVKIVTVSVNTLATSGSSYPENLETEVNTAISGLGGDWRVIDVQKRPGSTVRETYLIWLESV